MTMPALSPVMQKFIDCWGEMGARWGVNRTVAQTHALFFLSPGPVNAEEIASALEVARSNVSNSLRELEGWGLIKPVHMRGDRRQHFEPVKDVWEMFAIILDERKRREIDPTIEVLRECLREAQSATPRDAYTVKRLKDALDFFEVIIPLYGQLRKLPHGSIGVLAKVSSGVRSLIRDEEKR
jgi:DNA-binding transcriptional regulator GbsR (MarR family)